MILFFLSLSRRDELTLRLPHLECRLSSSEDDMLSVDDVDSTAGDLDEDFQEYALTFDLPGTLRAYGFRMGILAVLLVYLYCLIYHTFVFCWCYWSCS